jgi:hypothetical protein
MLLACPRLCPLRRRRRRRTRRTRGRGGVMRAQRVEEVAAEAGREEAAARLARNRTTAAPRPG